jgi:hypothetical protein
MESELDVLGVARKLVKYAVHLSKRKNNNFDFNFFFPSDRAPKQQMTNSWSQGILGIRDQDS